MPFRGGAFLAPRLRLLQLLLDEQFQAVDFFTGLRLLVGGDFPQPVEKTGDNALPAAEVPLPQRAELLRGLKLLQLFQKRSLDSLNLLLQCIHQTSGLTFSTMDFERVRFAGRQVGQHFSVELDVALFSIRG